MAVPRWIGPGFRPSRTESAFSVCAICDSICGTTPAAVSYLRTGLLHRHARLEAVFELQVEELHRIGICRLGARRDHQLLVEGAELQVAIGHGRDKGQDHSLPGLFAGEHLGSGRLRLAADAAPEIDLPGRPGEDVVRVHRANLLTLALAGRGRPVARLRIQRGARLRQHGGRLLDVRGGDLDVQIAGERLVNQAVEHRVLELLPPRGVRGVPRLRHLVPVGRRRLDCGPLVLRPHQAAGERKRDEQHGQAAHVSALLPTSSSAAPRGSRRCRRRAARTASPASFRRACRR